MTVIMSSEGDSSKSAILEAGDKSGADQNTDSSQDVNDVSDAKVDKAATENDTEKEDENDEGDAKVEAEADKKSSDKLEKESEQDEKSETESKTQTEEEMESEDVPKKLNSKEKKTKKEKVEKEVKEDKSEEGSEGEEEEEESEKDEKDRSAERSAPKDRKETPLLDQPLEKKGKRERKNVQRFNEEFAAEAKEAPKVEFAEGSGISLSEIPRVDASISRFKNEDLKILHRLLFKSVGKNTMVKKNIRKFNGFEFKKDSEEYTRKVAQAQKLEVKNLKSICEMLDLQKSGSKEEIVQRCMDFLMDPKDSGKPLDGGRPKRTAAVRANNRGYSSHDDYSSDEKDRQSRARRDKGKRSNLKDDSSSDEEFKPNQSDGSDERSRSKKRRRKPLTKKSTDDEESEASIATSEDSDDAPKSKRKKSPAKAVNSKPKARGTPGRRGRPPAAAAVAAKKPPGRTRKAKAPSSDEEDESEKDNRKDDGSSSEDEPLVKKAKNSQPPTDDEIKTFIKNILEGANLEEITMKTVCQRVYSNYPDFDLTHKKDFIKSTVKSLIST